MHPLTLITLTAFLLSLFLTPLVRRAALRFGLSDKPDGMRKLHAEETALGGGLAVLIGIFGAIFILLAYPNAWGYELSHSPLFLIGFMVSATVLCGIGLVDDKVMLRGRQKLLGQAVAATILILSGLLIESVTVLGWKIDLGLYAYPITLLWLLGAINALNLIDGSDGLAATVGLILSVALAGLCILSQHYSDGVLALAIAGALAGFLYHNLPPARIFLGDGGSMLIGLVLGALAIRSSLKGPATIALAAPTAIMAVPMFDVLMAVLRRKLTGRSIYAPDRGHLHHRVQARGYTGIKVVVFFGAICSVTAIGALISVYQKNELMALGTVAAVLLTLIVTRVFGHTEVLLLIGRLRNFLLSFFTTAAAARARNRQQLLQMRDTPEWKELWTELTNLADRFDLSHVRLNLNLPQLQDEFHATWNRTTQPDMHDLWQSEIPLHFGHAPAGKLYVAGACRIGSACKQMGELLSSLRPFENQLQDLILELITRPNKTTQPETPRTESAVLPLTALPTKV